MWLPDWLYEKLPTLYACGGVAIMVWFGFDGPSLFSSAALFGASGLIFIWRRNHRKPTLPHRKGDRRARGRVTSLRRNGPL